MWVCLAIHDRSSENHCSVDCGELGIELDSLREFIAARRKDFGAHSSYKASDAEHVQILCSLSFGWYGIWFDFSWNGNTWLKSHVSLFSNPRPILLKIIVAWILESLGSSWIRFGSLSLQYKKVLERIRALPSVYKSLLARFLEVWNLNWT